MKEKLLAVVGPTATGKTALAVRLAQAFGGEIISADSMQVYKGLDIGTAKPTLEEMGGVLHHLIGAVEPSARFSVADFVEVAKATVADITARGKLPVLVGGTGLYVDSLVSGVRFAEMEQDAELRTDLNRLAAERGGAALRGVLAKFDPETAARLHDNDVKRITRAIEIYMLTGEPMSAWDARSRTAEPPYETLFIGLRCADRQTLYGRIDARVDAMLTAGLLREVESLLASGIDASCTAMQAIGYKELAAHLKGELTLEEAVERVKRESRRYAKRQMTWFGRNKAIRWFEVDREPPKNIYENCKNMVENSFFLC